MVINSSQLILPSYNLSTCIFSKLLIYVYKIIKENLPGTAFVDKNINIGHELNVEYF